MEKVNKEEFKALERFKAKYGKEYKRILFNSHSRREFFPENEILGFIDFKRICNIILNDYELERSEEDILEDGLKMILSFITHSQFKNIIKWVEENHPHLINEENEYLIKDFKKNGELLFKIYKHYSIN